MNSTITPDRIHATARAVRYKIMMDQARRGRETATEESTCVNRVCTLTNKKTRPRMLTFIIYYLSRTERGGGAE